MNENAPDVIYLEVDLSVEEYLFEVDIEESLDMILDMEVVVEQIIGDEYEGPYTVTPTQSTQTLETNMLVCTQNITINPIPSNYGLITWNGATLTVS